MAVVGDNSGIMLIYELMSALIYSAQNFIPDYSNLIYELTKPNYLRSKPFLIMIEKEQINWDSSMCTYKY